MIRLTLLLLSSITLLGCDRPIDNSLDYYLDYQSELHSLLAKAQKAQPRLPYRYFTFCRFSEGVTAIKVNIIDSGSVSYIVDTETGIATRFALYQNEDAEWIKEIDSLVNTDNVRQMSQQFFDMGNNTAFFVGPDGISITIDESEVGYYRRSDYGLFIKYPDFPTDSIERNFQTHSYNHIEIAPSAYHCGIEITDGFLVR